MVNYLEIVQKKIEEISEINFSDNVGENLKTEIIKLCSKSLSHEQIIQNIETDFKDFINTMSQNANIRLILHSKNIDSIEEIFDELLQDLKELNNQKKLESLELKLLNNMDESSYSEFVKLKNELNRE